MQYRYGERLGARHEHAQSRSSRLFLDRQRAGFVHFDRGVGRIYHCQRVSRRFVYSARLLRTWFYICNSSAISRRKSAQHLCVRKRYGIFEWYPAFGSPKAVLVLPSALVPGDVRPKSNQLWWQHNGALEFATCHLDVYQHYRICACQYLWLGNGVREQLGSELLCDIE